MKYKVVFLIFLIAFIIIIPTGYHFFRKAINPYINIPVAKANLNIYDEIKDNDIKYIEVHKSLLDDSQIITNKEDLVGKYLTSNILKDEFFYKNTIVNDVFDTKSYDNLYKLPIPEEYKNIIYNYNKIDLWVNGKVNDYYINGAWLENINILYFLDAKENIISENNKEVYFILIDVTDEIENKLKRITNKNSFSLYPIIKNFSYNNQDTIVINEKIDNAIFE